MTFVTRFIQTRYYTTSAPNCVLASAQRTASTPAVGTVTGRWHSRGNACVGAINRHRSVVYTLLWKTARNRDTTQGTLPLLELALLPAGPPSRWYQREFDAALPPVPPPRSGEAPWHPGSRVYESLPVTARLAMRPLFRSRTQKIRQQRQACSIRLDLVRPGSSLWSIRPMQSVCTMEYETISQNMSMMTTCVVAARGGARENGEVWRDRNAQAHTARATRVVSSSRKEDRNTGYSRYKDTSCLKVTIEAMVGLKGRYTSSTPTTFLELAVSAWTLLGSYPLGLARGASSRWRNISIVSLRRAICPAYCFS